MSLDFSLDLILSREYPHKLSPFTYTLSLSLSLSLCVCSGGLVFNINQFGRRTGEAIVVIENEEQTLLALQRDRHYMQQRYIEVKGCAPFLLRTNFNNYYFSRYMKLLQRNLWSYQIVRYFIMFSCFNVYMFSCLHVFMF